jgi:hypothetical protein
MTDRLDPTFAEVYRQLRELAGGRCPIEAGLLARIADNECRHGRLPGDLSPVCGCWPGEPTDLELARGRRELDRKVQALHREGLTRYEIRARLTAGEDEPPEAA